MTKNMGNLDRGLRLGAAAAVAVLYVTSVITGTLALVLGILAAVFVVTSVVGFCPLYRIVGVSTCGTAGNSNAA